MLDDSVTRTSASRRSPVTTRERSMPHTTPSEHPRETYSCTPPMVRCGLPVNGRSRRTAHLLVFRQSAELRDWCTAFVAELGVRRQICPARPAGHSRRRQRTATVPSVIHVSIVSPLVSDVRHIAVPLRHEVLRPSHVVCFRDSGHGVLGGTRFEVYSPACIREDFVSVSL